jgi:hypothetical protein
MLFPSFFRMSYRAAPFHPMSRSHAPLLMSRSMAHNLILPSSRSCARLSTLPLYAREILSRPESQALSITDAFLAPHDMKSRNMPLTTIPLETSNCHRIGCRRRMPLPPLGLLTSSSLPEMTDVPNTSNAIRFISYAAAA